MVFDFLLVFQKISLTVRPVRHNFGPREIKFSPTPLLATGTEGMGSARANLRWRATFAVCCARAPQQNRGKITRLFSFLIPASSTPRTPYYSPPDFRGSSTLAGYRAITQTQTARAGPWDRTHEPLEQASGTTDHRTPRKGDSRCPRRRKAAASCGSPPASWKDTCPSRAAP